MCTMNSWLVFYGTERLLLVQIRFIVFGVRLNVAIF